MKEWPLSAEEARLWARVVASVEPLEGKGETGTQAAEPLVPSEVEGRVRDRRGADARPSTSSRRHEVHPERLPWQAVEGLGTSESKPKPAPNTLDGGWDRRLSRGLVAPDLAVDLHGHTLDTAYRTLDAGLEAAIARGIRVLLLVTGKPRDRGSGRGAIRAAVGDWLAASRHSADIAAVRGAHPRHGGTGALYIILKRRRAQH